METQKNMNKNFVNTRAYYKFFQYNLNQKNTKND